VHWRTTRPLRRRNSKRERCTGEPQDQKEEEIERGRVQPPKEEEIERGKIS